MENSLFLSELLMAHEPGRDAVPRVRADQQVGPTERRFMGSVVEIGASCVEGPPQDADGAEC